MSEILKEGRHEEPALRLKFPHIFTMFLHQLRSDIIDDPLFYLHAGIDIQHCPEDQLRLEYARFCQRRSEQSELKQAHPLIFKGTREELLAWMHGHAPHKSFDGRPPEEVSDTTLRFFLAHLGEVRKASGVDDWIRRELETA